MFGEEIQCQWVDDSVFFRQPAAFTRILFLGKLLLDISEYIRVVFGVVGIKGGLYGTFADCSMYIA